MNKKEFIDHYEIKDAKPIDPSKKALPAAGFSSAIAEFMENRFPGAARVECDTIASTPILVCAEYAAFFFKTLLTDIYGRAFLTIRITSDSKGVSILIEADELPLCDSEIRDLIRLARNAGFTILPENNTIRLTVEFSPIAIHRVYTVSIMDGKRIMLGKMVEIFCHGEPLDPDQTTSHPVSDPIKRHRRSKK